MSSHVITLTLPVWAEGDVEVSHALSGWPLDECDVLILPAIDTRAEGAPASADDEDTADGGEAVKPGEVGGDPYALLGLAGKRWTATQEDIRTAYRKLILKCHPDKRHDYAKESGEAPLGEEEANVRFRELQAAFEKLSDPKKRREFDSMDDFDGSTPKTPLADGADFFEVYAPVFERYSRWSERRPVPQLGAGGSAWSEVAAFYNFWFDFRSWRIFCQEDEHDLSEAEFREERRWMERQNEKARTQLKREESARIGKLVEDAYSQDPRVRAHLDAEKDAKESAKREAADRARREAEARESAAADAAADAAEAKRAQQDSAALKKKAKEKERDALRKARARVKTLVAHLPDGPKEHAALVCAELKLDALSAFEAALDAAAADDARLVELIAGEARPILTAAGMSVAGGAAAAQPTAAPVAPPAAGSLLAQAKKEHVWSAEELALLQKGSAKFPAGIPARWAKVADFINDGVGGDALTEKIVSEQVRRLRAARAASRARSPPGACVRLSRSVPRSRAPSSRALALLRARSLNLHALRSPSLSASCARAGLSPD
jgi:DnaJ family protein C protein 2